MLKNELVRITGTNEKENSHKTFDVQYVDVKRIKPKNHWSIKVLKFYNDIQEIMNESIGKKLDYQA